MDMLCDTLMGCKRLSVVVRYIYYVVVLLATDARYPPVWIVGASSVFERQAAPAY